MSYKNYSPSSDSSSYIQTYSPNRRRLPSPPNIGILKRSDRHVTIVDPNILTEKVQMIADSLEDTQCNLDGVNNKISSYKSIHDDSMNALAKLHEDLEDSIKELRTSRKQRASKKNGKLKKSKRRSSSLSRNAISSCQLDVSSDEELDYSEPIRRPSSLYGTSSKTPNLRSRNSFADNGDHRYDRGSQQLYPSSRQPNRRNNSRRSDAADRVEIRLREIDSEMIKERNAVKQYANDALLRNQSKFSEDSITRDRLADLESSKRVIQSELEATKRRLEKSEGGKDALMSEIADLRSMIIKSDKEKEEIARRVKDEEEKKKILAEKDEKDKFHIAATEKLERERLRQKDEIDELRIALKKSVGVSELQDLRRDLEKSERQRHQLSNHIDILTQDLEKKEQTHTRLLNQHDGLQQELDKTERDKEKLLSKLDEAFDKIKNHARNTDRLMNELQVKEQSNVKLEKDKEDLESFAEDSIRHLKSKCRKLEKDLERAHDKIESLSCKNEKILKSDVLNKSQINDAIHENDKLQSEISTLSTKCSEQETKLRKKEIEVKQVEEERFVMLERFNKLQEENYSLSKKLKELTEKLDRTNTKLLLNEKEVKQMKENKTESEKMNAALQMEVNHLKFNQNKYQSRISEINLEQEKTLKTKNFIENQLKLSQSDYEARENQLIAEIEKLQKELKNLHENLHENDVDKNEAIKRITLHANEEREFFESEIQRLNAEAIQAKSLVKDLHQQLKDSKNNLLNLKTNNSKSLKDFNNLQEKYENIRLSFDSKCIEVTRLSEKLIRSEEDLKDYRKRYEKFELIFEEIRDIFDEEIGQIEVTVDVNPTSTFIENPDLWIPTLQERLSVLKEEIKLKFRQYEELLLDAKSQRKESLYKSVELDRRKLMNEITEQNKLVDTLSREKTSLLLENKEARFVVQDLEDKVTNLTQEIHLSKDESNIWSLHRHDTSVCFNSSKSNQNKESIKEKERISERYKKYKSTIDSMQADLIKSPGKKTFRPSPTKSQPTSLNRSISPIRRVNFSDRIIHSNQPTSSSPKRTIFK